VETPFQCASRLLVALDELVGQEGMYLRASSFELAAGMRNRTEPIVARLVDLAHFPGVAELRSKVVSIVERSARHSAILEEKMTEFRAEIRRTDQARHRTNQLAPAYVRPPATQNQRFVAAG
jgi:hypothetical protein